MAKGTLYLDDGKSFDYKQGQRIYAEITWDNGKLESKLIDSGIWLLPQNEPLTFFSRHSHVLNLTLSSGVETPVWLEKVLVLGAKPGSGPAKVAFTYFFTFLL